MYSSHRIHTERSKSTVLFHLLSQETMTFKHTRKVRQKKLDGNLYVRVRVPIYVSSHETVT
jgi:hypothetical protein